MSRRFFIIYLFLLCLARDAYSQEETSQFLLSQLYQFPAITALTEGSSAYMNTKTPWSSTTSTTLIGINGYIPKMRLGAAGALYYQSFVNGGLTKLKGDMTLSYRFPVNISGREWSFSPAIKGSIYNLSLHPANLTTLDQLNHLNGQIRPSPSLTLTGFSNRNGIDAGVSLLVSNDDLWVGGGVENIIGSNLSLENDNTVSPPPTFLLNAGIITPFQVDWKGDDKIVSGLIASHQGDITHVNLQSYLDNQYFLTGIGVRGTYWQGASSVAATIPIVVGVHLDRFLITASYDVPIQRTPIAMGADISIVYKLTERKCVTCPKFY